MNKNNLPIWDLSDLYPSQNSIEIKTDMANLEKLANKFFKQFNDAKWEANNLLQAIIKYEEIEELGGKIASYAQLLHASNMLDIKISAFYQQIIEFITEISTKTLFFTLSINRLNDDVMSEFLNYSPLAKYESWIRNIRILRPHQLSDEAEEILQRKSITANSAWVRLFDETLAGLVFTMDGVELSLAEIMDMLSSKNSEERKKSAIILGKELTKNSHIFTHITNILAKDKNIDDNLRGFANPISSRNISNQLSDEIVATLISTVKENYANLSHKYYAKKAKWMGVERLNFWDRNAPLPQDNDKKYSWNEAVNLTLESYKEFSPKMAELGENFFQNNWIDVPPRKGKDSGAFAHPTISSIHPYLLLNFQGKTRDVMTLAHELGHGVHQLLAAKQGTLMADTPLTLAETASVFGEQLVFQKILSSEKNADRKRILVAGKIEDMLNTVVRQIAFCEFEITVHNARKEGELSSKDLSNIWLKVQQESLGDAIKFTPDYDNYWAYIPHFIHSPFYVYAYAFGDCLVNSLYSEYEKQRNAGNGVDFEKKYLTMLGCGGTLHHKELLAPFNIDISQADFWQGGLDIIAKYIEMV